MGEPFRERSTSTSATRSRTGRRSSRRGRLTARRTSCTSCSTTWVLGDGVLRGTDPDTEHRPDRREGRSLHAVPHDGTVLADPLVPAHRAQPHAQQHGVHHRGGDRVPERERDDPARERDAVGDPRRARLEHLHGREVAPVPDRRDEPRRDAAELAERPRLRALVRVPRRRDDQWYPDLVYDNHTIDQPSTPDEGYHLTDDITDKALEFIRDAKAVVPEKPFFLFYAPGACHAPHHAPKEWIDRFKGQFDMGYEAMREQTLANQKKLGIVPADTECPRSTRSETRRGRGPTARRSRCSTSRVRGTR